MAFIAVRATDGNTSKKGEVVKVSDAAVFGKAERLPRMLRFEVTGATADQIKRYLGRLRTFVRYSIINENAQGWRARMEVDPNLVAATGADAEFRQEVKDYILFDSHEGNWTASLHSQGATQLTVDIAKGQPYDLGAIKADVSAWFADKLQTTLRFRRYYFPDSWLDPLITDAASAEPLAEDAEGNLPPSWTHGSLTKAAALATIVDRLA